MAPMPRDPRTGRRSTAASPAIVRRPTPRGVAALLLALAPVSAPALPPAVRAAAGGEQPVHAPPDGNLALVRAAFAAWRDGRGSVFDLLDDDVEWTVSGDSPVSGTYRSRREFMERAVQPITARLASPIVPQVEHVFAHGDQVVVLWHGSATRRDGGEYRNRYAWHLTFADGRIVHAVAYLDTWTLAQLLR